MVRVLFVCLGNICRSPMAEALFAHKVREQGIEKHFTIDSAGTGHWHVGHPAHEGTRQVLKDQGIAYNGRARVLHQGDLVSQDYIVAMDRTNLEDILSLGTPRGEAFLLLRHHADFTDADVPDPYYDGRFAEVFELIEPAVEGLLKHICEDRGLIETG